jgi:hypothetical protein
VETVTICKAQRTLPDKEIKSVTIVIDNEFPKLPTLKGTAKLFEVDAEDLANALCYTLPGGTLDRLIGKLLERKATTMLMTPLFEIF